VAVQPEVRDEGCGRYVELGVNLRKGVLTVVPLIVYTRHFTLGLYVLCPHPALSNT